MRPRTYIRLSLAALVLVTGILLFSYSGKNTATNPNPNTKPDCCEKQCEQKRLQTEFVFWESLLHNLLTANH